MNEVEDLLEALAARAPEDLERVTLLEVGAADRVATIDSPFGPVWIAWSPHGVTGLTPRFACDDIEGFFDLHRRNAYEAASVPAHLERTVIGALERGDTFDVPIDLRGIGEFQAAVLAACATIQPGTTRTYGWIADELANPGAVRAVGTALGRNPIPLIVPCHRVIRADGAIGNYAFGPDMKQQLLVREGAILA